MAALRLPTPALQQPCLLDISVNRELSLLLSVDTGLLEQAGRGSPRWEPAGFLSRTLQPQGLLKG